MNIGTKSVLYGAHCFFLHPWFVAWAWWKLYGFPFDPRLWFAFFVHDLGYIGKPNMDGEEGELHPYLGAKIMGALFGKRWHDFTLYHSRFMARRNEAHFSLLCVADKLSIALTPAWLYLPMANWTGEIKEYMALAKAREEGNGKYAPKVKKDLLLKVSTESQRLWFDGVRKYLKEWAYEHRDGKRDTWTPQCRKAINPEGVWQ